VATLSIPLTQGKFAIIDEADFELVSQYKWHFGLRRTTYGARGYARARTKDDRRGLTMHRLILGATDGQIVDHRDGDGLNNTRANLRFVTHSQNAYNIHTNSPHGYLGVVWDRSRKLWSSFLSADCRRVFGLRAVDLIEAAYAHDVAARHFHGEFASLNFPKPGERAGSIHSDLTYEEVAGRFDDEELLARGMYFKPVDKSFCRHGHPQTSENLTWATDSRTGNRVSRCRLCLNAKARRRLARIAKERSLKEKLVKTSIIEIGIGSLEAEAIWESDPSDEGSFAHLARSADGRMWLSLTDMEEFDGSYSTVEVGQASLKSLLSSLLPPGHVIVATDDENWEGR
jgi:HNH endonuclease